MNRPMTRSDLTATTALAVVLSLAAPALPMAPQKKTLEGPTILAQGKSGEKGKEPGEKAEQSAKQAEKAAEEAQEQAESAAEATADNADTATEQAEESAKAAEQSDEQPAKKAEEKAAEKADDTAADKSDNAEDEVAEKTGESEGDEAEQASDDAAKPEKDAVSSEATRDTAETETSEGGDKSVDSETKSSADDEAQKPRERTEAAAALQNGEAAEPVEVTSETVTEETTRTSEEEVPEAGQAAAAAQGGRDDDDDDDDELIKILGAGAGGLAAGVLIGTLLNDGSEVVDSTGDRVIVERDGRYYVRKDENQILRRPGSDVRTETFRDGSNRTTVQRQDGTSVVTIRDADGFVVYRARQLPDGREIVLFDDLAPYQDDSSTTTSSRSYVQDNNYITMDKLPAFDPRQVDHVDYSRADRSALQEVLTARPAAKIDRPYTLRQVRESRDLRDMMPRLDLDVITFDTGSAAIRPSQARQLDELGYAMADYIAQNPDEVFLIEGHTDAIGPRVTNLALSDRRAETVALALTEYYDIPPENLFTQGYGEEHLKIDTEAAERTNRRATVRRITPLLDRTASTQ